VRLQIKQTNYFRFLKHTRNNSDALISKDFIQIIVAKYVSQNTGLIKGVQQRVANSVCDIYGVSAMFDETLELCS